jgi:D-arabinose 1-dehydrogenase-like Zn-dependent alcohol dehydrogenase
MPTMKAAQISKPGAAFEIVVREIPQPAPGTVRIKVEACGLCHSDLLVKEGYWPGIQYPRVPGHEVAGRVDAVGAGVTQWKVGRGCGLARRALLRLRVLPPRRLRPLQQSEDYRHSFRRRVRGIYGRSS